MGLVRVEADDTARLQRVADVLEAARRHDDPEDFAVDAAELGRDLRHGHDLNPGRLYTLEPRGRPVGVLRVDVPVHDNLALVAGEVTVHPAHRRRGHGSTLVAGLLDLARSLGRSIVWVPGPEGDPAVRAFAERHGFVRGGGDLRSLQVLAQLQPGLVDARWAEAARRTGDYVLERLRPPCPDALLAELVEVTDAINDAPMGTLDFEDEVYDLDRLRDQQTAWERRGNHFYRVVARHRVTGAVAGHTCMVLHPDRPQEAHQGETTVARAHRGHRLGLLLKTEMLRWLAVAEPRLERVMTENNLDNAPMLAVNQALGYRPSRTFATYQRLLEPPAG